MQRPISLFNTIVREEPRLSRPASGPPPTGNRQAEYQQDPEYFQHLLAYLRDRKRVDAEAEVAQEEVFA